MNIENTIKKIKEKLLKFKSKNKGVFFDDFKMIEECKKLILKEIENYTSENTEKTKQDVLIKIFNFFQLEKYFKRHKIPVFKIIFYTFLLITLLVSAFALTIFVSLFAGIAIFILLIILILNNVKKEHEMIKEYRINFIIYEALNELKEEFENEKREQFLKPAINVQLEQEELNELLSESFFEEELPDIKTEIYDRKVSLERRKRRKNLKTK